MTNISDLCVRPDGIFRIRLSENLDDTWLPAFCERFTPDIFEFHYRKLAFSRAPDDWFEFDSLDYLRAFEIQKEKTFDLFLVNGARRENLIVTGEKEAIDKIRGKLQTKYGDLDYSYYKNANNRLSVKVKLTPGTKFSVELINENESGFEFHFSSDLHQPVQWFLGRKSTNGDTRKFDLMKELKPVEGRLFLKKEHLFDDLAKSGGEVWEFTAKVDDLFFATDTVGSFASNPFVVNDAIKAELKLNRAVPTIRTHENDNNSQPKIKISVMGSCFSRQIFNSAVFFNADYKRFYECGPTAWHLSFPSMLSEEIEVDENDLVGKFQPDLNVHGKANFQKTFLNDLRKYRPDYLIIDNYVHVTAALIETTGGRYIDENYYLMDAPAYKNLPVVKRIPAESEEHFELFKQAARILKEQITEILPEDRIIVLRAKPAVKKLENGTISMWDSEQIIRYRSELWERCDSYFLSLAPSARVIDMRDEKYISEKNPHLQFAPTHFGSHYYRDAFHHLNKIVLQDLIKTQELGAENERNNKRIKLGRGSRS